MGGSMRSWIVGTVLICLVVLGLGGFLVVKPELDEASSTASQTEELAQSNDELAAEVATLKAQFAQIDEYESALAEARVKVPDDAEISGLLREIDAAAASAGVTLVAASPGTSELYTSPEATAEASAEATASAAATAGADATASSDANTSDLSELLEAAAAEIADVDGLYAIPVTVDVVGSYQEVRTFISTLQTSTGRYFLAGDLTLTRLDGGDASGGRPATEAGDVELAMSVAAFTLTATTGTATSDSDATTGSSTLPQSSGALNPFNSSVAGAEG